MVIFRSQKGSASNKKSGKLSYRLLHFSPPSWMRRFLGIFFLVELPPKCEFECSDALNADGNILFSLVSLIYFLDSWCLEFRSVCEREHWGF